MVLALWNDASSAGFVMVPTIKRESLDVAITHRDITASCSESTRMSGVAMMPATVMALVPE